MLDQRGNNQTEADMLNEFRGTGNVGGSSANHHGDLFATQEHEKYGNGTSADIRGARGRAWQIGGAQVRSLTAHRAILTARIVWPFSLTY